MSKYFEIHFKVGKDEVFTVCYSKSKIYRVENQRFVLDRYVDQFTTSAEKWNKRRTDIDRGGQCQEDVLPQDSVAMEFYKKWDPMHLQVLTDDQYNEMIKDLEKLKEKYIFGEFPEDERSVVMMKKKTSK